MSLPQTAQQALQAFSQASGWEQRARLLMQWGTSMPAMPTEHRTEDNQVHGCESQVWLRVERGDQGLIIQADSDARLLRGLLALLLARIEGLPAEAVAQLDLRQWFTELGLERQLSPSRSNGLHAVLQRLAQLIGR